MFKKKGKASEDADTNVEETVVTETVETEDGVMLTTTKTTIVKSGNTSLSSFGSAFKDFNLSEKNSVISSQRTVCCDSKNDTRFEDVPSSLITSDISPKQKSPKQSKSLSERLGLKPKTKDSKSESTPQSSSVKPGKFEEDSLKSHNSYRTKHGVPPLKLSKQLCAYSKEWADHLAATDKFQHRTERKYGENIYMKWSSNPNHVVAGNEAVESWYSEIKDHVFGKEPTTLKSGHFTQVIWKESQEVGVAWSRSSSGKVLVVANYNPAGNFVGKFAENVPPPK